MLRTREGAVFALAVLAAVVAVALGLTVLGR